MAMRKDYANSEIVSRARSLQGLTVTALPRNDLGGANEQVKEFMENIVLKKKKAET